MDNILDYKKIDYIAHIARTISCHTQFSPLDIYYLICKYNSVDLVIKGIYYANWNNYSLEYACEITTKGKNG